MLIGGAVSSCVHPAVVDRGEDEEPSSGGSAASTGGQANVGTGGQVSVGTGGQVEEVVAYCPIGEDVHYDPDANYPFCQLSDVPSGNTRAAWMERCRYSVRYDSHQEIDGAGVGVLGWVGEATDESETDPMNFCLCLVGCRHDGDCESPETGDAQAVCLDGSCMIRCEEGETCPDGMMCSESDEFGSLCGWGTRGTGCDTTGWPQVSDAEPAPVCPLSAEVPYDSEQPYAFCQVPVQGTRDFCGNQKQTTWEPPHTKDCFNCDSCVCQAPCIRDSDCASGETGDAAPTCVEGACMLVCGDDETCPDGMTCSFNREHRASFCGWRSGNGGCNDSLLEL